MAHPPTDLDRMNGRRLADRYELRIRRGSGGMAEVWEGLDHNLGRKVAIKILHRHLAANPSILNRFRSEAHAAARLTHPGIVGIYDTVTTDDTDAIIMELVDGRDLRTLLDERPTLALDDAAEVAVQLAAALGHAHQHGIIHRDVKPANILVRPDRRVKLSDFGIAKALDQAGHTESGSLVGTVKYLAPEQLDGATVDARTDLYALSTVLYEMLCGEVPFAASDLASAMRRLRDDPPSARAIRPDLPPAFDEFLQRSLARAPQDRFPDAQTWSASLTASLRGDDATIVDTEPSRPPSIPIVGPSTIPTSTATPPSPSPTPGPQPAPAAATVPAAEAAAPRPSGAASPRRAPAKADPDLARHHRRNRSRFALVGPLLALALMIAAIVTVWMLVTGGGSSVDSTGVDDPGDASSDQPVQVATDETSTSQSDTTDTSPDDTADSSSSTIDDTGTAAVDPGDAGDTTDAGTDVDATAETSSTSTTSSTVPEFDAGRRVFAFDPFGDNDEHGDVASRAVDGDAATYWYTQSYATRSFGNIKDGVGLVIEFEQPRAMTDIVVDASRVGWAAEIYEADSSAADLAGWGTPIATFTDLGQDATLDVPDISVTAVLLWVTDLGLAPGQTPQDYDAQVASGGFEQRLEINEIALVG